MSDLGPRIASGVVMMAAALGALWLGGQAFNLFWLTAFLAVLWEWQRLVGGARPLWRFAAGAVGLVLATAAQANRFPEAAVLALLASAVGAAALADAGKRMWSAAGVVYAGAPLLAVVILRGSVFRGFEALLWLFVVVWTTDIMAYFGGRLIGGPKLWPAVSPSKTWSGLMVGSICAALAGWAAIVVAIGRDQAAAIPLLVLGFALAVAAQAGDFFESGLKRRFSAKDAGSIIPGHGGVMDRLDGFIFACVIAAAIGVWRAGSLGSVAAGRGLLNW
jgi:phosphatidate cytidylyltransferase